MVDGIMTQLLWLKRKLSREQQYEAMNEIFHAKIGGVK